MSDSKATASIKLSKELRELMKNPNPSFSVGLVDQNLFKWNITMFGPEGTPYDEGIFQAVMTFPDNYPFAPPTLVFKSKFWHPNVYLDGRVCISILHDAGDDPHQYEDAGERWSPAQSVESILLSVISMLSSPNADSPANVEAAVQMRGNLPAFRKKVRQFMNAEESAS
ncbi:hypothetical protein GGI20_004252 [Coemansia sp. BCRC 34301]|nr:hypothetical protein GGI20_004252 [Coemansia sp. BCRC 34301]